MGPATHQDKTMLVIATTAIKDAITRLVRTVLHGVNGIWPVGWPDALKSALLVYAPVLMKGAMRRSADPYGSVLQIDRVTYMPLRVMADAADAIGNAAAEVFDEVDLTVGMCWVHVWRAVKKKCHLLKNNSKERQDKIYEDLNYIHNLSEPELVPIAFIKFYAKWARKFNEQPMADYIKETWFDKHANWQRAHGSPGEPSDNNTLESFNRTLKTDSNFGKTTSLGLCLVTCEKTVYRQSRDTKPMASIVAPVVKKDLWVKAQKLVQSSHFKLTYKMGNYIIVPSQSLISRLPGKTVPERKTNISTWVKEYVSMMKNPTGYAKVVGPHSWDFDTLMDYVYSFYMVEPIPGDHPHCMELAQAGVIKKCNCPQGLHYHVCKHALGLALDSSEVGVPTTHSTQIVGKRAASPGAKSSKRAHCLALDYN
jgi:hypothetical protein